MTVRSLLGFVRWYLRELTGEGDYDRYLAERRTDPHLPVLSRREYERRRAAARDGEPLTRCC